ncbi:TIGR02679 family protein [bacterium]|nr:TIGR02679 family protein [bacterium]
MSDRLVMLLRSDECSPLLSRLRKKFQRGESLTGRCRFSNLTREQATRISELTGAGRRGDSISVDLDQFTQVVVNTGRFDSLESLVQLACGKQLQNLRATRDEHSAQWQRVWRHSECLVENLNASLSERKGDQLVGHGSQTASFTAKTVSEAVSAMRQSGWLRRTAIRNPAAAMVLLDQSFALLELLPVHPTPLPVFAAKHCGDSHALDDSTNLGRIMLRLLTRQSVTQQKKAFNRRRIWESVGVVTDELSSTALALNLPASGNSLTDQLLQNHRGNGMPVRLTFRHLRVHPPTFVVPSNEHESRIYVCENPSILAEAANRLGAECPPIICVEGHPSLACWVLLEQLCARQFRLAYHGDFDWGGIRIANEIYDAFGFEPWRFTSSFHITQSKHHRKLRPPESEALWDQNLAETIRRAGVSIEEEAVIDDLLFDLQSVS